MKNDYYINNFSILIIIMFCQYKDLFGKPNQGIHSYRLPLTNGMSFAIIDILLTFIAAKLINIYALKNFSYIKILIGLFLTGIILHKLFCVETSLNKILFL